MSTMSNINWRGGIGRLVLWCAMLTVVAYGQSPQAQPEKLAYGADRANVPDAITKVKSGDFGAIDVDLIVRRALSKPYQY